MEILRHEPSKRRVFSVVRKDDLTLTLNSSFFPGARSNPVNATSATKQENPHSSGDLLELDIGLDDTPQTAASLQNLDLNHVKPDELKSSRKDGTSHSIPEPADSWEELAELENISITEKRIESDDEPDPPKRINPMEYEWVETDSVIDDEILETESKPMIVINFTKLLKGKELDQEAEKLVKQRVEDLFEMNFKDAVQEMLDVGVAHHVEESYLEEFLLGQSIISPEDKFHAFDYPLKIGDEMVSELWHTVIYPTKWESVNLLKRYLRDSSRELTWKSAIAEEIEKLAEREDEVRYEKEEKLHSSIDQLTHLRDSLLERLESEKLTPGPRFERMKHRLGIVEGDIMELVNGRMKDLEADSAIPEYSSDDDELLEVQQGILRSALQDRNNTNYLDLLAAMILQKYPRNPLQSEERHFRHLAKLHMTLRATWLHEFGRLPAREGSSSATAEEPAGLRTKDSARLASTDDSASTKMPDEEVEASSANEDTSSEEGVNYDADDDEISDSEQLVPAVSRLPIAGMIPRPTTGPTAGPLPEDDAIPEEEDDYPTFARVGGIAALATLKREAESSIW